MIDASPEVQFALAFAMNAKNNIVYTMGIGAELRPAIIGFELDGSPIGLAQMQHPAETADDAIHRVVGVGSLMRSNWHAASIAIVAEGYVAVRDEDDEDESEDGSLAKRFADGDKTISECMTVAWASDSDECELVMAPYSIGLGRRVIWNHEDITLFDDSRDSGSYAHLLSDIVNNTKPGEWLPSVPQEIQMLAAGSAMSDLGFVVKFTDETMNLDWMNGND